MARDYFLGGVLPSPDTPLVDKNGFMTEPWRLRAEAEHTALFGDDGADDVTQSIPTGSYLANVAATSGLGLSISGTPAAGWTATFTLAQDIRTSSSPQFVNMTATGNIIVNGNVDGRDLSVDGTKLDGIASGATANSTDAALRARSSHTGTQAWSTITSTPTTISGYGITDAYTKTEVDTAIGGKVTKTTGISDASTSHAVTDFTETNAALDALGTKINEIIDALNA